MDFTMSSWTLLCHLQGAFYMYMDAAKQNSDGSAEMLEKVQKKDP